MSQHELNPDLLRVKDVLRAIEDAIQFSSRGLQNRLHMFATAYAVAIIGEACAHITPEIQKRFSDVPWSKIIGARHKIIHGYGKVDIVVLEEVVRTHLPLLKTQMQAIAAHLSGNQA